MNLAKGIRMAAIGPVAISAGVLIGWLSAGGDASQAADEIRVDFLDDEWLFCPNGDRLNFETATVEEESTDGYATREEALADYVAGINSAGSSIYFPNDLELTGELRELFAPARDFRPTERTDVTDDTTYFDLRSVDSEALEARIVVERVYSSFLVTSAYICELQTVSDPAAVDALLREAASQ